MADMQFTAPSGGAEESYGMSGSMSATAAGGAAGVPPVQMFSDSSHPIACVFHLAFKAAAFVLYIFGSFLAKESKSGDGVAGSNFVVLTVVCILLSAADFWVVKNVTGRLLVGLRWWCQVEPDGTNRWIFESAETTNTNRFDNFVFWSVLYGTPTVWAFCLFLGIIKLNLGWLITACMALSLSGANLYGYYKCSTDQKAKFQAMVARGTEYGVSTMLKSGVLNLLGRSAAQQAAGGGQPAQSTFV